MYCLSGFFLFQLVLLEGEVLVSYGGYVVNMHARAIVVSRLHSSVWNYCIKFTFAIT